MSIDSGLSSIIFKWFHTHRLLFFPHCLTIVVYSLHPNLSRTPEEAYASSEEAGRDSEDL